MSIKWQDINGVEDDENDCDVNTDNTQRIYSNNNNINNKHIQFSKML